MNGSPQTSHDRIYNDLQIPPSLQTFRLGHVSQTRSYHDFGGPKAPHTLTSS